MHVDVSSTCVRRPRNIELVHTMLRLDGSLHKRNTTNGRRRIFQCWKLVHMRPVIQESQNFAPH
eukprot:7783554-Pyramimonas_sp.AAC.1